MARQAATRAIYVTGRAISSSHTHREDFAWEFRGHHGHDRMRTGSTSLRRRDAACDSSEARESAPADKRPTLADHSMTHRNPDAPPADNSE